MTLVDRCVVFGCKSMDHLVKSTALIVIPRPAGPVRSGLHRRLDEMALLKDNTAALHGPIKSNRNFRRDVLEEKTKFGNENHWLLNGWIVKRGVRGPRHFTDGRRFGARVNANWTPKNNLYHPLCHPGTENQRIGDTADETEAVASDWKIPFCGR